MDGSDFSVDRGGSKRKVDESMSMPPTKRTKLSNKTKSIFEKVQTGHTSSTYAPQGNFRSTPRPLNVPLETEMYVDNIQEITPKQVQSALTHMGENRALWQNSESICNQHGEIFFSTSIKTPQDLRNLLSTLSEEERSTIQHCNVETIKNLGVDAIKVFSEYCPNLSEDFFHAVRNDTEFFTAIFGTTPQNFEHTIDCISPQDRGQKTNIMRYTLALAAPSMTQRNKANLLLAVAAIHPTERLSVVQNASLLFNAKPTGFDRASLLGLVAKVNPEFRQFFVSETIAFFKKEGKEISQVPLHEKIAFLSAISIIDPEQLGITLNFVESVLGPEESVQNKADLLRFVQNLTNEQTQAMMHFVPMLQSNTIDLDELHDVLEFIVKAPIDKQAELTTDIYSFLNSDFALSTPHENVMRILQSLLIIPEEERSSILQAASEWPKNVDCNNISPVLLLYLLPEEMRSSNRLNLIQGSILGNPDYREAIKSSLYSKLTGMQLPRNTTRIFGELIYQNSGALRIVDDHPLMLKAIEILSMESVKESHNPFVIYNNLVDNFNKKTSFTPPYVATTIRPTLETAFDQNIRISLERAQESNRSELTREDLPKEVTKEAFENFFTALKGKISNSNDPELKNTWSTVELPFVSQERFLLGLLENTSPTVSEAEGKFRAILADIFSKSSEPRPDAFLTEQEEAFMTKMLAIQSCSIGQQEGISIVYSGIDQKHKYTTDFTTSSSETPQEAQRRIKTEEYVGAFLDRFVATMDENNPGDVVALFMQEVNNSDISEFNTFMMNACDITGSEGFDEDETEKMHLTAEGAKKLLQHTMSKDLNLFTQNTVQTFLEETLTSTAFIKELIGLKGPLEQGSHQARYLMNLAGGLLGIAKRVTFDPNTGLLYDALLQKTQDEVLQALFTSITPESLTTVLTMEILNADKKTQLEMRLLSITRGDVNASMSAQLLLEGSGYFIHEMKGGDDSMVEG